MPMSVTDAGDHLFVRLYGAITAADFLHYAQEAEAFERRAGRAINRISDMTGVETFEVSHRDVFELADRRKRQLQPGIARLAMIAVEPIQIGLARMYQTMTENPQIEIKIVPSLAEAQAWISRSSAAAPPEMPAPYED